MTRSKNKQLSVRINALLIDEFKTFCRDWSGRPHYLVFSEEIETAIRLRLAMLKEKTEEVVPLHDNNRGTPRSQR